MRTFFLSCSASPSFSPGAAAPLAAIPSSLSQIQPSKSSCDGHCVWTYPALLSALSTSHLECALVLSPHATCQRWIYTELQTKRLLRPMHTHDNTAASVVASQLDWPGRMSPPEHTHTKHQTPEINWSTKFSKGNQNESLQCAKR